MNCIRPHKFGFTFAVILGTWHALWALLVWAGAAQWILDFVFRLHMIAPPYQVTPFNLLTAIGLIALTSTIGYVSGWFLGFVWDRMTLQPAASGR